MKIIKIKRQTRYETRHHPKMGCLVCLVTRIKKYFLGIPIQTIHKYRETSKGKIKDTSDCRLSKV